MRAHDKGPPSRLLAYRVDDRCRLSGRGAYRAEFIAIGMGSARVRREAKAESLLRHGECCLLHLDALAGSAVGAAPGHLACMSGQEVGLRFSAQLNLGILNLQQSMTVALQPQEANR